MDLELSGIFVYPLKSAAGVALDAADLDDRGFVDDRRYMVVDENGQMTSQRELPRMCLIQTALVDGGVEISAPGMEPLRLDGARGPRRTVTVWRSVLEAPEVSEAASEWMSTFLGRRAAIVHMPSEVRREINPKYAKNGELVSFADGYPFLVATEASLSDLSARVGRPLEMIRFRPNLVVRGGPAWHEDQWTDFRVGDVDMFVTKPCVRCVITTIDPATGEKGKEPLRTMARFRDAGDGPTFGMNVVARGPGRLRVGDRVVLA